MTPEEMAEKLSELEAEKESLLSKVKELKSEKLKLKSKYEDIDPEQYNKIIDEVESLRATNEKLQKQYKTDLEKLSNDLNQKDTYLQKKIVDDGLRQSLIEAGVPKEFITPAMAMLKSEIKLANDNGEYKALVGETALNEFVPKWYNEGDGKVFNIAKPDTNAGTNGKPNTSQNGEPPKAETLKETYSKMFPN